MVIETIVKVLTAVEISIVRGFDHLKVAPKHCFSNEVEGGFYLVLAISNRYNYKTILNKDVYLIVGNC